MSSFFASPEKRAEYSTMMHRSLISALAILVVTLLVGCGDSSSSDDDSQAEAGGTVSGLVSLGPVSNANVSIYRADEVDFSVPLADQQNLLLGSARTNQDGGFSASDTGSYDGPLLLVVSVDDSSMYYDESSATQVSFSDSNQFPDSTFFPDSPESGHVLFAILPAPMRDVGITPLTTAAVTQALTENAFPLDAQEVRQFNEAIRAALAPQLQSILSKPAPFDSNVAAGTFATTEADQYALLLAAFADMAEGEAAPALAFLRTLIGDLKDGRLDVGGDFYTSFADFLAAWQQAIIKFAQLYGTPELQAAVAEYEAPSSTPSPSTGDDGSDNGSQVSGLDCAGLRAGEHDGFCATVDGKELSYLTRLNLEYTPGGDSVQVMFYEPVEDAGTMSITVPLNAGQTLSCQNPGTQLQLLPPPEIAASTFLFAASTQDHTDCTLTYSKTGRVISGTISGTLGTLQTVSDQTHELTEGSFRISLPRTGDEIRGVLGGTVRVAPDVTVGVYRPGKRISFSARNEVDAATAVWWVTISDLAAAGGTTDCASGRVTYRDETHSFTPGDCQINFNVNNGTLTGSFSGTLNRFEGNPFDTTPVSLTNGAFTVSLPDGPVGN